MPYSGIKTTRGDPRIRDGLATPLAISLDSPFPSHTLAHTTHPWPLTITTTTMTPSHLLPLAILLLTTLAAPSSPSHPRQEVSLVPQPAQAPCDAYSETCRPVIQANACFAAFISFGTKPEILQCVDDQNEGRAEELVSSFSVASCQVHG